MANSTGADNELFGFKMSGTWANTATSAYSSDSRHTCYLQLQIDTGSGWSSSNVIVGSFYFILDIIGGTLHSGAKNGITNITVGGVPLKVTVSGNTYKIEINGVYEYSGNSNIKVRANFHGAGYNQWGSNFGSCYIKLDEYANNAIGGDTGLLTNTSNISSLQYIEPTEPMAMSRMVEPKTEVMLSSQDTQQTETFKATQLQVMERFDPKGNSTGLYLKGRKLNESVLFE